MSWHSLIYAVLVSLLCISVVYAETLNQQQYSNRFSLHDRSSRYWPDVEACLKQWGDPPFKDLKSLKFRVIKPDVKVLGVGSNVVDDVKTIYPQLIYIRPAVSVMSKTTYKLMNPNGWYCFKSKVNVLGESIIKAACNAHIITSKGAATVLGKGEKEHKGTTVLGESSIERDCK
jgi:hypothetical protein